ncbi:hypothetical protein OHB26_27270 [Nocardia sp. NBC_01503]|uniref:hypothetical protein n=1 Tax=Nocardia sp. NBC_01503 TaxID=2975997 RepID=UPI002E7BF3F4|nr:hypothetical protein [Nocardia sp. NBC_01503]WTL30612.1 hypothetical protein OHB26_27270 [Nocardia sp. NBC_01503]
MNATIPARLVGVATAVYGAAVVIRPEVLLRPTGLGSGTEPELRATARLIALRDLVSGLALAIADDPAARRTAAIIRVACDAADTSVFGIALDGRRERVKTLAVTAGWGALCALAAGYEVRGGGWPRRTATP